MRKQADMTSKGHAKALILKPTEETSRHDLVRACKAARPQTNRGNEQTGPQKGVQRHWSTNQLRKQADKTAKGHAKAVVLKPTEETSRHDRERACRGARPQSNKRNKQT